MTPLRVSEAQTRYNLIDPQLKKAGWNLSDRTQVAFEIPVAGYDGSPLEGFTDYCLYSPNGDVLAVVEAKRTSRDARVGKQQLLQYLEAIEKKQSFRPFGFMANGDSIFFWDSKVAAERQVAGFFSRENLERLLFLKQNHKPLNSVEINRTIVERSYQTEAIRRISEAIEVKKKRKALLVMATGTGKTRTIMALIDLFLRTHNAQRVLFLADRDALVDQALTDGFKTFLPNESRARIRTYDVDEAKRVRICVATLQTLELCYGKFTPADFDLIITDECHRSIYNKFTDVLAYFDGIQIGLTATPAEFIDRDTFKFFDCHDKIPTFLYTFDKAVEEKYLVDKNVYAAQTKFQRQGIKGANMTEEEKETLRKRGIDPDDIDYEGTDLERKVTNKDTLRAQWEEFMDVCYKDATGQYPGKSIIFAVTHQHAMRLSEAFEEMYPEFQGKLVQVIDSKMERARDLLANFKKQDMPRIAISVDMLDTGVDIPEVTNLAFMKPVNSQIKFWQMIGRGTRCNEACRHFEWLPSGKKEEFLIVDYWENFDHFNMMPADEEGKSSQVPVLVTIFIARLQKLRILLGDQSSSDAKRIIRDIRSDIARIPQESYSVRRVFNEIRDAWDDEFWRYITEEKLEFLRLKVGPMLRFIPNVWPSEAFFISKMERCGLAHLQHKDLAAHIKSIREDVALLPTNIAEVKARQKHIDAVLSNDFWVTRTLASIDEAREALAPVMRYKRERPSLVFELGLDDIIAMRKWVFLRKDSQRMYVEEYRKLIEERIEKIAKDHPTIQKLKNKEEVKAEDLIRLEESLETELGTDEISLDDENMLKAFGVRVGSLVDFLKHVLGLEELPSYETVVQKAFDAFILGHNYNADQSRFLRVVQNVFLQRRNLVLADLYEEPFTNFGSNAVERLFGQNDVIMLIELTNTLAA
ncbi:MAG: DEAD/DEAH box helicase family protein [Bacteroidota bacterium]